MIAQVLPKVAALSVGRLCPICGYPVMISLPVQAPDPGFHVLVEIAGEPRRLADPVQIGGRKVCSDGRYQRTEIIPIVQVYR